MDAIQEKHERAVGDTFIGWYNAQNGTTFVYQGRPGEAPDLTFVDGEQELLLEIADSYYDKRDAEVKWQNARDVPGAPKAWYGANMDAALADQPCPATSSDALFVAQEVDLRTVSPCLRRARILSSGSRLPRWCMLSRNRGGQHFLGLRPAIGFRCRL